VQVVSITAKDIRVKLLPCPFCGSSDVELANTWTPSYWVECNVCEARAGCAHEKFKSNADAFDKKRHRKAAKASAVAWNSRAE